MRKIFMVMLVALITSPILAGEKQPSPSPTPKPVGSINLNSSRSNRVVQPTVTPAASQQQNDKAMKIRDLRSAEVQKVNEKDGTFTVMADGKEVSFSAREMKALPAVGDVIDITYTQTTPGGPLVASPNCCIKSSKSNSSDRMATPPEVMTGKVISQSGNTFKVISNGKGKMPAYGREGGTREFTFSGTKLTSLPKVGDIIDITYTQTPNGLLEATAVVKSKSNITNN
jgi:hypothetical protein